MPEIRPDRPWTAVALALLLVAPLSAGVVFEVETTYHSGSGSPEGTEMSVEEPNLKMEILPSEGEGSGGVKDEVIYRGDRREVVVVNHRDKSYMVIDAAAVQQIGSQVGGALSEMQEQMAKALEQIEDPEQRRRMEEMLERQGGAMGGMVGGATSSEPEYRKTGETGTHAGYPCVKYEVWRDGEKLRELWVTDWDNVEGGEEAKNVFVDMAGFWQETMGALQDAMGGGVLGGDNGGFGDFTEVDGFPVMTRSFDGGELESETTLRSNGRRTLDPDEFEPPAGYKRRSMLGG